MNLNQTVAVSQRQNYDGIYNLVAMDLTITVLCERNFRGSDCTQCAPGFTETNCDRRDHCFGVSCSENRDCSDNEECICKPGFTGELCQTNIDDCIGVNCSGNGVCMDGVNNYTCECMPGFSGPLCRESGTIMTLTCICHSTCT